VPRLTPVAVAAVLLVSCSGHAKVAPGLKHARAACGHWAKLNVGIGDVAQRQAESAAFQREATAAAAADAGYKQLQTAADSWEFAQGSSTSPASIDALRSAIDQSRSACAGVPTK
jgi:23S rRNA G2445 N2-methylase RlmL